MATSDNKIKRLALREIALFLGLLFLGLVLLPIGIYLVGNKVFGTYGGHGFVAFFGAISSKIRNGEMVAWFLVLSPYLAWQTIRLTLLLWRVSGRTNSGQSSSAV